jgi:hypothetical protein
METLKTLEAALAIAITSGTGILSPTHLSRLIDMRKQVQKRITATQRAQQVLA